MSETGLFNQDHADIKQQIEIIGQLAMHIPLADAEDVLRAIDRVHTILPIVDPTAYRNILGTIDGHRDLVAAFATFRRELDRIVEAGAHGR